MFERTDLSITQQAALADMRGDVKRMEAEIEALTAERDEAKALLTSAMDGANQLGALGQRESDRADDAERRHEVARGCVHQLQSEVARLQSEVVAMRKERVTHPDPTLWVPRCTSMRTLMDAARTTERCCGALGHRSACFGGVPPPPPPAAPGQVDIPTPPEPFTSKCPFRFKGPDSCPVCDGDAAVQP